MVDNKYPLKEEYAKITILSNDNEIVESLEGRINKGGTINIDGSSAVRRTCSFTITTENKKLSDAYWTLHTRFKLEKGNKNMHTGEIEWKRCGVFYISSFNCQQEKEILKISIQGKDKMSKLNGDLGGVIGAKTDFGTMEIVDHKTGVTKIKKIPIIDIIINAVHQYGMEPYDNIIINDLDEEEGLELWEYRGPDDEPLFIINKPDESNTIETVYNATFDKDRTVYVNGEEEDRTLNTIDEYKNPNKLIITSQEPTKISLKKGDAAVYNVTKIEVGNTAGYHKIELVYPEDLILNAGETIVTLLTKLKDFLGNYEFFYDIDGHFVFQKKRAYKTDNNYSYIFDNNDLFTALSTSTRIEEIKNDFVIWGSRQTPNSKVDIHARYAVDKKPTRYQSIDRQLLLGQPLDWIEKQNEKYCYKDEDGNFKDIPSGEKMAWEPDKFYYKNVHPIYTTEEYDWRELIYRMAYDWYQWHNENYFLGEVAEFNSEEYPEGITGYEQYYMDLIGFWRDLYDSNGSEEDYDPETHWSYTVINTPENLNFWFDFIDIENSEISKYSVKNIGIRTKTISDNKMSSVYYPDVPSILYVLQGENPESKMEYVPIQIPRDKELYFIRSAKGKSSFDCLEELISKHIENNSVTNVTTIPLYDIQENTKVLIKNNKIEDVNGEYVITNMQVPLDATGSMSVTLTRIL